MLLCSTCSGVLPDIQEEFEITEAGKAGFIQTAFVIMYAVGAPSFGYWGDRYVLDPCSDRVSEVWSHFMASGYLVK